jgi:type IV pilus assembly protein PilO
MLSKFKQLSTLDLDNMGDWPVPAKRTLIVFVFVMVLFIGYKFDTSLKLTELSMAQTEESSLKAQYKTSAEQLHLVDKNEDQMQQMKSLFTKVLAELPREFDIDNLLDSISRAGRSNNLSFKLLHPSTEIKNPFYGVVPITVIVDGDYHHLANFISDVANLDQPLRFTEFSIKPISDKDAADSSLKKANQTNLLELSLTAEVYRYTRPEEVKNA